MDRNLIRIIVAAALFAAAWLVPYDALLVQPCATYMQAAAFAVPYLVAGCDVLAKAARGIAKGDPFNENLLMGVATLGAFALAVFPGGEGHFAEAAAVMILFQLGEYLQDLAVDRSRDSIRSLMDIAPEYATALREGAEQRVAPGEVQVGELISVRPGERIPLDGLVAEGESLIDTSALTGEGRARCAVPGDAVMSGCICMDGRIAVQVTAPYGESTVARVLDLVENARGKKAATESFIRRFARVYTPIVCAAALIVAVVPPLVLGAAGAAGATGAIGAADVAGAGAAGTLWATWVQRALIFLVVSCPCALVISVPLAFFAGIGGAGARGILVKGGTAMETLAKVRTLAFDKTGTLTDGVFEVREVHAAEGFDPRYVVHAAAQAEGLSNHPIARALCRADGMGEIDASRVRDMREIAGHGVIAQVEGAQLRVGSALLVAEALDDPSPLERACGKAQAGTVVHVSRDGRYLGCIILGDRVKPGAREAIDRLRALGICRIVLLSGDREQAVRATADELGIDRAYAELLPNEKLAEVERLIGSAVQERGSGYGAVAFVGDGINDAPVIMRADAGIAMGAFGSAAAIEAADIVLMNDEPADAAQALAIARKTVRIARQNIAFALAVKLLFLALAVCGLATMWMAVFADVGVCLLAVLNATRCAR